MKEQKKKWKAALPVICAAAVGLAAYGKLRGGNDEPAAVKYQTATASNGSIAVVTEGSGSIEAATTRAVTLEYDGKLETIYAETGDQVAKGDTLACYDTEALDRVITAREKELAELNRSIATTDDEGSTSIKAPVTGRIKRIFASVGDQAFKVTESQGGVAEISADGKLRVEFVSGVASLTEGDSVTVDFDSHSVAGTVEKIDGEHITVTIKDDTEYQVDSSAVVWGKSGTRLGEGRLLANHPYLVQADYGIIDSVKVTKESFVNAGDTLFTRKDAAYNQTYLKLLSDREELVDEIRDLKEYQKNPVVVSEYDGYIVSMEALEGMTYEKEQQLCTIADAETLYLKVDIDELDIDGVREGQSAEVVFDAFEEEAYTGTVEKISGVGKNAGGVTTYTVTIALKGDSHLKNAMSATASITLDSRDNVLLIPVDALQSIDGQRCVQLLEGESVREQEVSLGLINDEYAEVREGLSAGDVVVVNSRESTDLFTQMMNRRNQMLQGGASGE